MIIKTIINIIEILGHFFCDKKYWMWFTLSAMYFKKKQACIPQKGEGGIIHLELFLMRRVGRG